EERLAGERRRSGELARDDPGAAALARAAPAGIGQLPARLQRRVENALVLRAVERDVAVRDLDLERQAPIPPRSDSVSITPAGSAIPLPAMSWAQPWQTLEKSTGVPM